MKPSFLLDLRRPKDVLWMYSWRTQHPLQHYLSVPTVIKDNLINISISSPIWCLIPVKHKRQQQHITETYCYCCQFHMPFKYRQNKNNQIKMKKMKLYRHSELYLTHWNMLLLVSISIHFLLFKSMVKTNLMWENLQILRFEGFQVIQDRIGPACRFPCHLAVQFLNFSFK